MSQTWLIRGARPLGGEPADILIRDGLIDSIGASTQRRPARRSSGRMG